MPDAFAPPGSVTADQVAADGFYLNSPTEHLAAARRLTAIEHRAAQLLNLDGLPPEIARSVRYVLHGPTARHATVRPATDAATADREG